MMDVLSYALSKKYTDEQIAEQKLKMAKVEKELNDYKSVMAQVNINQEAKQQVSGYGFVSLPKNAANGQVGASVKGLTVTNLLEYGEVLRVLPPNPGSGFAPVFFDNLNLPQDKYLIFYELMQTVETFSVNSPYYNIFNITNTDPDQKTKNNTVGRKVWKLDAPETITKIGWWVYNTESEVHVKNFMVVKATEEDWLLSEEKLVQKYNWHNGTKSTVGAMRLKSVGKNLFDGEMELGTINWSTGVNAPSTNHIRTKNYIKVKENTSYILTTNSGTKDFDIFFYDEHKERISSLNRVAVTPFTTLAGTKYVRFVHKNINVFTNYYQLKEGGTATAYEPYTESNMYLTAKDEQGNIAELRSLPNGTKDEIRVSGGKAEYIQRTRKYVLQESDIESVYNAVDFTATIGISKQFTDSLFANSNIGCIHISGKNQILNVPSEYTEANVGKYYTSDSKKIGFIMPKGTTLEQAREQLAGLELTYQLATPIEKPIQTSGSLVSYPSGTVYIEPFVADAGVYADKIEVLHQDLPIKAIEQLSKVDFMTGIEVPLDVGEVEIDESGLSFTHPDLTEGDIVFFVYEHGAEGTIPETEISYYDSRYTIKDSVTDKFYKWNVTVADGVPSIELVEV